MNFFSSAGVIFGFASAPKNPQPTQNTITPDNSVPAFLKVQQKSDQSRYGHKILSPMLSY